MMVRRDIKKFIKTIPKNVTIVAATKYVDTNSMMELYDNGIKNFGENRVDAFLDKYSELSNYKDIVWHFIGHLQRNKAKMIIDKIDYLHSLDSIVLANIIDKNRTTPLKCFVEVSINLEEQKDGVPYNKINDFISEAIKLKNIEIIGFMMMSKKASTSEDLLKQFKALAYLKNRVENDFKIKIPYLSMGMSDDYIEAINAGATHIRLGRILWEELK
ncbi:MAG: YggS family pyridoxal phosphate-dependent enzyme [Anaeroplasma sp.]